MSSSTTITRSKEEENFLNVAFMLSKHSLQALRFIVDREIDPLRLQKEVFKHWSQMKCRLSQTQQKILKPPQGVELRSEHLDISLMTCLLRHIVGMKIYDNVVPVSTDHNDEAAISTIKYYRNKIAHATYFSFPDTEFHKICDDVIKVSCEKLNPTIGAEIESFGQAKHPSRNQLEFSTSLFDACHEGNKSLVEVLLQEGVPINEANHSGFTPLHIASHEGHTNVVELLLSKGATEVVNKVNENGSSPLHLASHEGHIEIVELLLQNGANVHQVNNLKTSTPLHLAVHENHKDVVELLLKIGAKVNEQNKNGSTALHLASYNGHTEIAKLLLENGADVNLCKSDNRSPLHLACREGRVDIVTLLCEHKACVDQKDNDGRTALFYAEKYKRSEIIEILQKASNPTV
ncbi:ANK [Mytilus edulis]|uniref:ANK n=1 Tax=Mytilus edulis TaxID=6550 RepID=A0A8S3S796_MYTED|nr:ANK [Mytilus edulis]